ncbi:MAG: succinyl-diaminopimelate desuccinylase [Methylomonas sp.]|jgi:succinyl-diaminopimelate desuccinylase
MSDCRTLLEELIRRVSVTPEDAGCQTFLAKRLQGLDFKSEYLNFADTQNIWLRRGRQTPLFVFLGHTDVVPPGPLGGWDSPPFEPVIRDGKLFGRGAADMKGSIAAFIIAVEHFIAQYPRHKGSLAILLTSDEEGPAQHGVVKAIEVLEQRLEKIDWCLVGEPSSKHALGDIIRVGRRGSINAKLTVYGIQGHVAYPELAENPIHRFAPALHALTEEIWDLGNNFFPASSLQLSNIIAGSGAENIIPGQLEVQFNIRFSTELNAAVIKSRTRALLDKFGFKYDLQWRLSGEPFLTKPGVLLEAAQAAVKTICQITPLNDTGGGTSDGRFIAPTGAQVIELGPINASIHKVNEYIDLDDLEKLSRIYEQILFNLLN